MEFKILSLIFLLHHFELVFSCDLVGKVIGEAGLDLDEACPNKSAEAHLEPAGDGGRTRTAPGIWSGLIVGVLR